MPVIGLTGGIASGKSAVGALFRAKGAVIFDADLIARELVAPGQPALAEIDRRFGKSVILADGNLDRAALGSLVFSDAEARRDLNAILHPKIFAELRSRLAELDPETLGVVEAALLVDSAPWQSGELDLDALVVVASEVSEQVLRAARQRGMTESEVLGRVKSQVPSTEREAAADYVLDNTGTLQDLERSFEKVWLQLVDRFHLV
jgi:dephospho-CoA kinase